MNAFLVFFHLLEVKQFLLLDLLKITRSKMTKHFCFHVCLWFFLSLSILLISSDVEKTNVAPSDADPIIIVEETNEPSDKIVDSAPSEAEVESSSKPTSILVFGGNGLLGADAVEKLLKLPNGADIYLGNAEDVSAFDGSSWSGAPPLAKFSEKKNSKNASSLICLPAHFP